MTDYLEGGRRCKNNRIMPGNITSQKPFISVITIFNNPDISLLENTVKNVIAQRYNNIEYIVIDGYASSETINILKRNENRIDYWLSKKEQYIYPKYNKGIEVASGEWINFMNAGDYFYNDSLLADIFDDKQYDADILYGDALFSYNYINSRIIHTTTSGLWKSRMMMHTSMFVKSSILKKIKFNTQYQLMADYDFCLNCYVNNYKFQHLDKVVSIAGFGGVSNKRSFQSTIEHWKIVRKYRTDLKINLYYFYTSILAFLYQNILVHILPEQYLEILTDSYRKIIERKYRRKKM